ncbi:MAG TPA: hypothetical protein VGX50_01035 [Longimicrobium sp.]|jgi:hypothetical protein|nr:hypothetical protein [Longimicrobium sp.]
MDPSRPQDAIPQALLDAVLDPERRDQTVATPDGELELRFDPEPGVGMRIHAPAAPAETIVTTYDGDAERPASYPPGLPYLPGIKVMVGGPAAGAWAMWNVPGLQAALAELQAQSAAAGWTESSEPGDDDPIPGLRTIHFRRPDGERRVLQITPVGEGGMISLFDNPGD